VAEDDDVAVVRLGSVAFSSLPTDSVPYFLNGTAGEIATTAGTNSAEMGVANGAVLETRYFDYNVEPDTDIIPNTSDGTLTWKDEPEISFQEDGEAFGYGWDANGDWKVEVIIGGGNDNLHIAYTADGGITPKKIPEISLSTGNPSITKCFTMLF